jgi:hypothetical protein
MSKPYEESVTELTLEKIQAMTDGKMLQVLVNDTFNEENDLEEYDVPAAKKEIERAERALAAVRQRWDEIGTIRYWLESRCKELGVDPAEGYRV